MDDHKKEKAGRTMGRKLSNFFVRNDLRFRVIGSGLISMTFIYIATLGVTLYPHLYDMFVSNDVNIQYRAAQNFLILSKWLVPAVAVILILAFYHHVTIMCRICGPLVNFAKIFKKFPVENFTRKVFFRHGGTLKKECKTINEIIESAAQNISQIRADHDKLISSLEDIITRVDETHSDDEVFQNLKRSAESAAKGLSIFRNT